MGTPRIRHMLAGVALAAGLVSQVPLVALPDLARGGTLTVGVISSLIIYWDEIADGVTWVGDHFFLGGILFRGLGRGMRSASDQARTAQKKIRSGGKPSTPKGNGTRRKPKPKPPGAPIDEPSPTYPEK